MKLFEQVNRSDGWLLANAFGTYPSQSAGEERVSKLDIQCLLLFVIPDGFDRRRIEPDPLLHSPY